MATAAHVRSTMPMIEPRAVPAYALISIGIVASAILVPLTGFMIAPSVWPVFLLWPFLAFAGMLLRRIGHATGATVIEATALIYGQGLAFLLVMFPLTALSAPLADVRLAGADQALGFSWTAYAWAVAPIIDPLVIAYKSFDWQPLLVIAFLATRPRRLWRFVAASALALLITTIVYPFAPAVGSFRHYALANYPMKGDGPLVFGSIIELVKAGHRTISPDLFTGFVSFPSYHAAAAVLFSWALWPLRTWRWPVLLLNAAMIAAAPIVGGHYFVDVIAGLGVAAGAIYLSALCSGSSKATE